MFVFKAAVVGAGTMGGEIAQAIAAAEIPVVLKDIDQKFVDAGLDKAREVTQGQLGRLVKKEKLTQEQADEQLEVVMGRITGTTDYSDFGDVDFVIEAAPEKMEIKQTVFAELDAVTPGHAILASNTSSLSIAEMADATLRPHKVVGFHFFYPASVMPLVEIVAGVTDEETIEAAVNFAQTIRKQPIVCEEVPGFVVNRILNSAVGEIWRAQEEQGLSIKKIDEAVGAQNVAPMGPFFLVDLLGLDTVFHVAEHLNESYGDSFYVHQGMKKLVEEGKLGAKSGGSGFYENGEPQIEGDAEPNGEELAELMSLKAIVEACLVLEEGVSTVREIDLGMMAGAGMDPRRGIFPPFTKADLTGLDVILEKLEQAEEKHGERFASAGDAPAPRRAGQARPEGRPGLLRLSAGRRGRPDRDRQARDARRRRDRLACERDDERGLTGCRQGPRHRLGEGQVVGRDRRDGDRLGEPARVLGRRRHQGVHADGRGGGRGPDPLGPRAPSRPGPEPGLDDRGGQLARLRRRLRGLDGVRLPHRRRVGDLRPAGDQARDHPRASAARSACRAWSARTRRSR